MVKALTLRQITTEVHEAYAQRAEKEALEWMERELYPMMEAAAKMGRWAIECHVMADLSMDVIIRELNAAGYKVAQSARYLRINWLP